MIDVIEDLIKGAVSEVFTTMLSIKTEPDPTLALHTAGGSHVATSVGFIGQVTGIVFIYSNAEYARVITSRMLGLTPDEIDSEELINDSMGELGNIVVGHIKSRLCDRGMSCVLTIPSIIRGSQFSIQPVTSATRTVLGFRCDNTQQIAIEVLIKAEDKVQP